MGALGGSGTRIVDLARFLVGEPCAVMALTKTFIGKRPLPGGGGRGAVDVDDAFAAVIELEGGCLGTLEATRFALGRKNHQVFEVNGSLGSLSFNLDRPNELNVHWPAGDAGGTSGRS